MRTIHKMCIIIVLLLVTACTTRKDIPIPLPDKAGNYKHFMMYAQKYIREQMKRYNVVGVSVALIDSNRIVWSQGFGYADKEKRVKATQNTIYRIGSVTKVLNSVGILKAQEQNKINIDYPIRKYLPHFAMKSPEYLVDKITLKSLLAHHSGIGAPDMITTNFENNPKALDCAYGINVFRKLYLAYTPHTATLYSNQGTYLSSCILEKQVDENYTDYIQKNILLPLEMNHSIYDTNINLDNGATPYRNGNRIKSASFYTLGAVGLNSNVIDMGKLLIMILNDGRYKTRQILKKSSIEEMLKIQNRDIKIDFDNPMALGLFVENHYEEPIYYHTGRSSGYLAAIAFSKRSKLGIVVLVNDDSKEAFLDKITKNLLKAALETKYKRRFFQHVVPIEKYAKSDFEGRYVLEPVSMDYMPSMITIVKTGTGYKVDSGYGSFDLKKEHGCYMLDSTDTVVNQIEEFRKVPKNSCLYTIENRDIKFIFYQSSKDFVIIASAFRDNHQIKKWDDYLGSFLPITPLRNKEKSLRIDHIRLIKKDQLFVLEIYMEDGFVMRAPLQIIDEKHARVAIAALTSIDVIEIEKRGHHLCINFGIHRFCRDTREDE